MNIRAGMFCLGLSTLLASTTVRAEDFVEKSTTTVSPGIAGENVSAEPPIAMTDSSRSDVFVTLTRNATLRNNLPSSAATVTPEAFTPYDAQNAGDVLARQTSIRINSQGRLGATRLAGIRGASSNQTLVMIDGRPVSGVGLSASQDLAEIPTEQIDRIEIVRGGVSALYGPNALGGVINVITKRASHQGLPIANVTHETRSYRGQAIRINAGTRQGPVDAFFFGNQQKERGFRTNSDAKSYNVGGNAGVSMGKAGKFVFDMAAYHNNSGQPGQLVTDIPPNQYNNIVERVAQTPVARQITDTQYLRTSYLLPLPMNSLGAMRFFGSQRQVEFNDRSDPFFPVDSDRHEQSKGGELQLDLPFGFTVGGTFVRDRLDSRDRITPGNNFVSRVENWGIFIQETFKWRMLTLIPSGRYDHHSIVGESKNPRVQLIADANDWLRFSGSAGRSFRAPTIDDMFYPFTDFGFGFSYQGNPNLQPEKAWTYDAGFELHDSSSSFSITYFRANASNLIQTTNAAASTTVNVGTARRQGIEVEAQKVWGAYFKQSLNYTLLENMGVPLGFTDRVQLRLSPKHTFNSVNTLTLFKGLTWDNTYHYVSASHEGNNKTGVKIHDHFTWDMRLAYQIRQLEVFGGISNLTDKRYRERAGFPLPGRTLFGGVSVRLWG